MGRLYDPRSYETLQEVETDRAGLLYTVTRKATVGGSPVSVALPLGY